MNKRTMNGQMIEEFGSYLENEEKSPATLEKYLRDVRAFWHFAGEQHVTRELVRRWKDFLVERKYAVRSVNSMLASVNSFLQFLGWEDCKVKSLKLQRKIYCPEEKELTKSELQAITKMQAHYPKMQDH